MPDDGRAAGRVPVHGWMGRGAVRTRIAAILRRIAGMPDYPSYVEHLRRCHPQLPILTERQFFEDFLRTRYGDGPTRCC